ncbi:hypothetical protein SUGI_1330130 [Cryptomeria japonica]|uniref:RNase III domain-containing protein n=1 Tax=Cryptomeria japonica TaxID=3369 RepID=A0AAD3NRJ6_CRYJA|nr:hypothetical protein SUGI_1330130 [Cryptomeria japonica]
MEWIHFRTEIDEIESILKYSFNNKDLLKEALESYHRLEFFGDAVLEFLIAINVYKTCKEIDKKTFVKLVTINVENDVLGRAALKNKFHNYLLDNAVKNRADKCEEAMADESISNSDVKPPKVLANLIEALVGAVHVDSAFSFEKVWEVFKPMLNPVLSREENPSTSETVAGPINKAKKKQCKCNENKTFIENLKSDIQKPSYKSDVLDKIEGNLKYSFKRKDLLRESFCKPVEMLFGSASIRCDECTKAVESAGLRSYESLEFLGTLFFKLAIAKYLYMTYPHENEGVLSCLRSEIMGNENLARVAVQKLGVDNHLTIPYDDLSDMVKTFTKEINENEKDLNPPSVLFNIVESIAGAMFLDSINFDSNNIDSSEAVVVINMREGVTSEDSIGSAKHQPRDHHRLQGTNEWGKQLALRDLIHLHVAERTTTNRHAIESSHVHNFDLDKEEGQDDQHVSATESVVELCDVESNIVGGQNRDHSKGGLPWM